MERNRLSPVWLHLQTAQLLVREVLRAPGSALRPHVDRRVGAAEGRDGRLRSSAGDQQRTGPGMGCRSCPFARGRSLWQTRRARAWALEVSNPSKVKVHPQTVRPRQEFWGQPSGLRRTLWTSAPPCGSVFPYTSSLIGAALHNALHIICILSSTHHSKPSQPLTPVACPPCLPLSAPTSTPSP